MNLARPLASAALAVALCVGLPAAGLARAADAPRAAWEAEVDQEVSRQDAQIDRARASKSLPSVVSGYASRLARDRSALNHFLYGRALFHAGDPIAARAQMQYALDADPVFWPARIRLALLLIELKNYAEAEQQAARVLAERPGNPQAVELMTRVAIVQKDWDRAVRFLRQHLDRQPGDAAARSLLAQVHAQRRDWDASLEAWRVLLQADPSNREWRLQAALVRAEKGDLASAAAELEALSRERAGDLPVLDALRSVYARQRDWARLATTLERMAPLLGDEKRKEVAGLIEQLRKGGPPSAEAPAERAPSWPEIVAAAASEPDAERRARLMRIVWEGTLQGEVAQLPGGLLRRVMARHEPDPVCRAWVARILAQCGEMALPLLATGLHDPDATVRMVCAEVLGDSGSPAALLYLLPLVEFEEVDRPEYETLRRALSALTGHGDLPPGRTAAATAEDAAASRESWRRWRLSDAATPLKVAGIRQLGAVGEATPDRFLHSFVQDPVFEVMREAYLALRAAVRRKPLDAAEAKVFPKFPAVADSEVTRPGMKALQDRVAAWWGEFAAERRALMKARGTAPGPR